MAGGPRRAIGCHLQSAPSSAQLITSPPPPGSDIEIRGQKLRRDVMLHRTATILAMALLTTGVARAVDDPQRYPDWKGQWTRAATGVPDQPQPPFDPSKPWGLRQEP